MERKCNFSTSNPPLNSNAAKKIWDGIIAEEVCVGASAHTYKTNKRK